MMSKHTPGPWWSQEPSHKTNGVRSKDGFICFIPKVQRYTDQEDRYIEELQESRANTSLIAAAPELLEALSEIVHNIFIYEFLNDFFVDDSGDDFRNVVERAQLVITKAKTGGK